MGRRRKHVELPNNLRGTLARNLDALMHSRMDLSTQPKVGAKARIGASSVGRMLRAEAGTRLETVEAIAGAFGLDAWQLLWPGLQPEAPPQAEPVRLPLAPAELAGVERLRAMLTELNPRQRDALMRDGQVAEILTEPSTSRQPREPLFRAREGERERALSPRPKQKRFVR